MRYPATAEAIGPQPGISNEDEPGASALSETLHPLLGRQLKRWWRGGPPSGDLARLLAAVNQAYHQSDGDRHMVERSLELSSQELLELNGSLRQSVSLLETTLAATADGIVVVDEDQVPVSFNPRFASLWQIPDWLLDVPEEALAWVSSRMSGASPFLASPTSDATTLDVVRDVRGQVFECYSAPRRIGRTIVGRVYSFRDISGRERSAEALKASEERYRLLFERNPQPMLVYDVATLGIVAVNEAAVTSYGYLQAEFLDRTILDIAPPDEVSRLREHLASHDGQVVRKESVTHLRKDGTRMDAEITSHAIAYGDRAARLVVVDDVTEKRHLEAQLRQAQKMESIGRLAGGVAHDFNNLLAVITGFSDLLRKDLGAQHPGLRRVEQISRAANRAADLTAQLLAFSRKQVLQPKVLDLNEVVADVEKMLRRIIGEHIELATVTHGSLGAVKADAGQLQQVILNLAVNARDAMPRGGRLIVETSNTELDDTYGRHHAGVAPGPYVLLAVSDTGCGMDPATLAQIFEPFFTTKPEGQGTGLGLATVYGIVKQSGGHVSVYSEPGRGSTFRVYLPRVEGTGAAPVAGSPSPESPSGTETILLVEDAEPLRAVMSEVLEHAGYRVLECGWPQEAKVLLHQTHEHLHLMLTDIVMPGMSGAELAAELAATHPDCRIVYMSGYTGEAIGAHGVLEPGATFLQKPFPTDLLLRTLRRVLDER